MALDPNTKTIKILNNKLASGLLESENPESGAESTVGGGATATTKRRTTRKKKFIISSVTVQKEGGGSTSPGTLDQLAASSVPGSDDSKATGVASNLTEKAAIVGTIAPSIGGAKPTQRVVLAKSRKKSSIILAGPKASVPSMKHKKTVKKLNVNLHRLTRKVQKANKIETKTSDESLENIKAALVKAELVNATTKAPEKMLRQMYSDLMVLKKRAL